jgi:hypothetical protein
MIFWVRFIKKTNIATNELVISNLIQSNQALIVKVVLQNAGTVSQSLSISVSEFCYLFLRRWWSINGIDVQLLKSSKYCFSAVFILCFIAMIKVLKLVLCFSYNMIVNYVLWISICNNIWVARDFYLFNPSYFRNLHVINYVCF